MAVTHFNYDFYDESVIRELNNELKTESKKYSPPAPLYINIIFLLALEGEEHFMETST